MVDAATGELAVDAAIGDLPTADEIGARAAGENFSVASILLGRETRAHLQAIYGYARLVDEIGDAVPGDRLALLAAFEADLARIFDGPGPPVDPVLRRLEPTVVSLRLPRGPFERLIAANRRDQEHLAYRTHEELLAYCDLSANPVGELVLHVFGAASPDRIALSDRVCTALQLAEHWQDVAEDYRAGRIYLPAEDLARFGVAPTALAGAVATAPLRRLLAFEVTRASRLLDEGAPLVGRLQGRARLAVAGYVGGGRAALAAIATADYDVLAGAPRAGRARRARATFTTLLRRR
jgi:squalene synthase HpnC